MLFRILYVVFLTCQLLWGSYYLGGIITPRQLMVLVMFVACVAVKEIKFDRYWWLYSVFLLCFGLSSFLTGFSDQFIHQLIGLFFASYVAYRSTFAMVKRYHSENVIINTFLVIGLLDALVTIGQFFNYDIANTIVDLMHFSGTSERFINLQDRMDTMYGVAIPGIVGDVLNGYLLSFVSVFALYNKNGRLSFHNIIFWLVIVFGSYCVQERSGFFTGIVLSVFMMFKVLSNVTKKYRIITFSLFFLVVILSGMYLFDALSVSETRYSIGFDMSSRDAIYGYSWDFFIQHPFGGFFLLAENGVLPHNLFLSALIFGGLIGGVMICIILWMQFSKMLPSFIAPIKGHHGYMMLLFALAYVAFTVNSLWHNLSIVSGDATLWIIWGGFLSLSEMETAG